MKNFNTLIFLGFTEKIRVLGGGHENPIHRGGGWLKRGAWIVCRFKRGLGKKEGGVFEGGGVDTPMHTMGDP